MPIPIHQIHVSGGFSLPLQQSRKKKMVACLAGCLFCLSLAFLSCLSRDGLQEHDPKWIRAIECLSKIRVYMNLSHLPSFPRGTLFCCFITVASVYFLLLFSPFVLRCFTFIQLSYRNIRGSARSASDIVVAYRPANRAAAPYASRSLFSSFSPGNPCSVRPGQKNLAAREEEGKIGIERRNGPEWLEWLQGWSLCGFAARDLQFVYTSAVLSN